MNRTSGEGGPPAGGSTDEPGPTRRAVLAAGGTVLLGGLAGCSALDGVLDRASEQVVGTTVSAPTAFYAGRRPSETSASSTSGQESGDGAQYFGNGPADVQHVPATVKADSQTIELEGWSTSAVTQAPDYDGDNTPVIKGSALGRAQDYNSSRSNKFEWWAGPDDGDDSDEDGDILDAIHDVELGLLNHVTTAQDAVAREDQAGARQALDAFINATTKALEPALEKCGNGVCETVQENSAVRKQGVQIARRAVDEGNWATATRELEGVEEIVLGDIERLDDELVTGNPLRPRFIDIIEYLRGDPTIAESFTISLPDAKLPGDRGSLAEVLSPKLVHANGLIDEVREDDKVEYDVGSAHDGDCDDAAQSGPVTLHEDMVCGNVLSAALNTFTTESRAMVGYSTDGGAVVSGAPASADTDGKCVFVAPDGTLREAKNLDSWGQERTAGDVSVSETLVCPVTVSPNDCACPLPGLLYVRRIIHDDQIVFAGGWVLDEGALFEDSATLLFAEGPTEVASVTPEDIRSDDYDDRIVEQFARDRSQYGSLVGSAQVEGTEMNKAELIEAMASHARPRPDLSNQNDGQDGLNSVIATVIGDHGDDDGGTRGPGRVSATALDAPLVHLSGAGDLSTAEKAATGRIETGVINSGEEVDILGMGSEK